MANAEPRLTTHGESCFDPALYASMYYGDRVLKDNTLNVVQWYLDEFRTIFRDGTVRGRRILDLGSGPVVGPVIPAARWHNEIYLSDKWKENTDYLEKWRRGDSQHMKPLMEYFAKNDESQSADTLNQQVVSKTHCILELDLTKSESVGQAQLEGIRFDTITAGAVLQVASTTIEEFKTVLFHTRELLDSEGHLVVSDVIDQSSYSVGEIEFKALSSNPNEIQFAYKECGFEIEQWRTRAFTLEPTHDSKSNTVYAAVVRKR